MLKAICLLSFITALSFCDGFIILRRPCTSQSSAFRATATDDVALTFHHTAIKTRNITLAIQFYSLLGFEPSEKFRTGPAKAAWLEQRSSSGYGRLELIEVPPYLLNEPEGMKRQAIDLAKRQDLLGQNHLALDVTKSIQNKGLECLSEWIDVLNQRSVETFGKTLRVAVEPMQQMIGSGVYELAFLYDADGALIELLHQQAKLPQKITSGWEPRSVETEGFSCQ